MCQWRETMIHTFDVDLAKEYGVLEAIILNHMEYWIAKNQANQMNYYDGRYWTYNSTRAFAELFPYVSQRQIQTALKRLIDNDILLVGNYNKYTYDRTLWYAFSDKGKSIMQKCKMDYANLSNGLCENVNPIPNNNTDNNTNNIKESTKEKRPTLEEVKDYCNERNNDVDPNRWYNYYSANGWKVGKNPMKDWKAAVRTWERKETKEESETSFNLNEFFERSKNR